MLAGLQSRAISQRSRGNLASVVHVDLNTFKTLGSSLTVRGYQKSQIEVEAYCMYGVVPLEHNLLSFEEGGGWFSGMTGGKEKRESNSGRKWKL